jgi:dihydroxyacid dehydratase/phosphogluconate dehydratase
MGTAAGKGDRRRLRSVDWFGEPGRMGAIYRSWVRGYTPEVFDGRPVIGIANSWSELTPCNAHLRRVADAVKQGVWQAGGFPLEFPTTSIGETLMRPTAMLFRNLMSMDVEETLRANPLDGVVLLSGCDKTTPAMLMGAASVDLPAIMVTGGRCCRASSRAATSARVPTSGGSARRCAPGGCRPRTSVRPRAAWLAAMATA